MTIQILQHIKRYEYLIIFLFLLLFSIIGYMHSCQIAPVFNIDNQIISLWKFTLLDNMQIYKDVYFPYGILFYYEQYIPFFSIIQILLTPILFISVYSMLRKITNSFAALFPFGLFMMFIINITTIKVFNRYGILVSLSILLAYVFWNKIYPTNKNYLLLGTLLGIIFSLVHDQAVYAFPLIFLLIVLNPIIRTGVGELMHRKYYLHIVLGNLYIAGGFMLGIVPFALYLAQNKILPEFINYMFQIMDFSTYGKTPFIPFGMTIDNIFIYISIFLSLFYLLIKFTIYKKFTFSSYVLFALLIVVILMEQKSLVRSIATQITFISLLLYTILGIELNLYLKSKGISVYNRLIYLIAAISLLVMIGLQQNKIYYTPFINNYNVISIFKNDDLKNSLSHCFNQDKKNLATQSETFYQVVNAIKKDSKDAVIFDFLSDPIFYGLLNQNPSYYLSVFESSPLYAQIDNIKYIERMKVNYVIYNMNFENSSDGVPSYARENLLFKYISTHFEEFKQVDNFIILKKKVNADLFTQEYMNKFSKFTSSLLTINLASIPKSEGLYKSSVLNQSNVLAIASGNLSVINKYLERNTIDSANKIVVIIPKKYTTADKIITLTINSDNNLKTTISFTGCDVNKRCIINLRNVPLFYKTRNLKHISMSKNLEGNVELYSLIQKNNLW